MGKDWRPGNLNTWNHEDHRLHLGVHSTSFESLWHGGITESYISYHESYFNHISISKWPQVMGLSHHRIWGLEVLMNFKPPISMGSPKGVPVPWHSMCTWAFSVCILSCPMSRTGGMGPAWTSWSLTGCSPSKGPCGKLTKWMRKTSKLGGGIPCFSNKSVYGQWRSANERDPSSDAWVENLSPHPRTPRTMDEPSITELFVTGLHSQHLPMAAIACYKDSYFSGKTMGKLWQDTMVSRSKSKLFLQTLPQTTWWESSSPWIWVVVSLTCSPCSKPLEL